MDMKDIHGGTGIEISMPCICHYIQIHTQQKSMALGIKISKNYKGM
jgi:hypothetical protein